MNKSNFVKTRILYIIGAIVLIIFAFKRFYKTEKGRELIDDMFLKMPVVGIYPQEVAVAKFTCTSGTMLSSGVAILEALDIVAKTAGNKTIEKVIYKVRVGIAEGQTIADPLFKPVCFRPHSLHDRGRGIHRCH
ncbi:MAG: type II secretion system F family protein [Desulfobacterales bacterium]